MTVPAHDIGLVGDIGGTNIRLAIAVTQPGAHAGAQPGAHPGAHQAGMALRQPESFACAAFADAASCIAAYLARTGARPVAAVLAVAGPVTDGRARMTNHSWALDEGELAASLGLAELRLMNDFAALALAAPLLGTADSVAIGPDNPGMPHATIAVMGPGTGFGLSALAGGASAGLLTTEGGHVAFAPTDETELAILRILARRYGRVSIERILAGQGLADLHAALAEIADRPPPAMPAAAITEAARRGDPDAAATVDRFCAILGATAGDLALALGARGGVFIAGGIAPRLLGPLAAGIFRARFEDKGRFAPYMRAIPTRVITAAHPALLGAADELARLLQAQPSLPAPSLPAPSATQPAAAQPAAAQPAARPI